MDIIREDCIYARQSVDRKDSISIESQIDFCKYELKGGSCKVFKDKEDCSTQEDIFNYPQNDKSEAAENPLPHFSIMTINLVPLLTHTSNTTPPHIPYVLRVPVQ